VNGMLHRGCGRGATGKQQLAAGAALVSVGGGRELCGHRNGQRLDPARISVAAKVPGLGQAESPARITPAAVSCC